MTTGQLAIYQADLCSWARSRIVGVGAEQYDDDTSQRFEGMSVEQLWLGLREEIADSINYLTMLDIRIGRAIKEAGNV